jgi:hypothetical protein
MTRAWKGGLKLHIQSSMNNKQAVKLKVIKYYAPASNILTQYPVMSSLYSAPSDLLEFSSGNQIAEVKLPFMYRNRLMYNARNSNVEALQHGMYYIYLAQPLVVGDSAPTTIEFNVYMSCDQDFQFYGYSKELVSTRLNFTLPTTVEEEVEDKPVLKGESAEVMNRPTDQKSLLNSSSVDLDLDSTRLNPLVDIRPLIRRFQKAFHQQLTPSTDTVTIRIPLSALYGEYVDGIARGSNGTLPWMYYGKSFGLKFKVKCLGAKITNINFVAPNAGLSFNTAGTFPLDQLSKTLSRAPPVANNFFSDTNFATLPLPGVEWPISALPIGPAGRIYEEFEFTIPNTTIYKYIGGAQKFSTQTTEPSLTSADFGQLMVTLYRDETPETFELSWYYGFTDESRFGHHAFAPVCTLFTKQVGTPPVTYLATPDEDTAGPVLIQKRSTIYFSNLSTSYT